MTMEGGKCDVCRINPPIGVACSPFGAVSFAYCVTCFQMPADAEMMFHYLYCDVANGDVAKLHPYVNSYYTFRNGKYISFLEWVEKVGKNIDLEEYWADQAKALDDATSSHKPEA